MYNMYIPTLLLLLLSLLSLLITPATPQVFRDPTGFGPCNMCVLLDNPRELTPCSQIWRELMAVCSSDTCTSYSSYVSKAPATSSCTHTPPPLPGGTAPAGFSFGSWQSVSRGSETKTATGTAGRSIITGNATTSTGGANRTGDGAGTLAAGTPRPTATPTEDVNTGFTNESSGARRVVVGGVGVGWLWEMLFLLWGAVW